MLGIVLITRDEGRDLELTLDALDALRAEGDVIVVADLGSRDGTRDRLDRYARGRPVRVRQLEADRIGRIDAMRLAASCCPDRHLLALRAADRLHPAGLRALRRRLAQTDQPAGGAVLANSGWRFLDGADPLPRADAARLAALAPHSPVRDLARLLPDPARLVLPAALLTGDWARAASEGDATTRYRMLLDQIRDPVAVLPETVLLRPRPLRPAAPAIEAVSAEIAAAAADRRADLLEGLMLRVDEALTLSPGAQVLELAAAMERLHRALPRRLRAAARAHPGPAGHVLSARHRGGLPGALSALALYAAGQAQARADHLAGALAAVRRDVDLALPGADYLELLYARSRGL